MNLLHPLARWRERRAAARYDRALRAPLSPASVAEIRRRLQDGTIPRRTVRRPSLIDAPEGRRDR